MVRGHDEVKEIGTRGRCHLSGVRQKSPPAPDWYVTCSCKQTRKLQKLLDGSMTFGLFFQTYPTWVLNDLWNKSQTVQSQSLSQLMNQTTSQYMYYEAKAKSQWWLIAEEFFFIEVTAKLQQCNNYPWSQTMRPDSTLRLEGCLT